MESFVFLSQGAPIQVFTPVSAPSNGCSSLWRLSQNLFLVRRWKSLSSCLIHLGKNLVYRFFSVSNFDRTLQFRLLWTDAVTEIHNLWRHLDCLDFLYFLFLKTCAKIFLYFSRGSWSNLYPLTRFLIPTHTFSYTCSHVESSKKHGLFVENFRFSKLCQIPNFSRTFQKIHY